MENEIVDVTRTLVPKETAKVFQRNSRINKLASHIHLHLDEELSLDSLAAYIGLTRSHLSRYFHEKTGMQLSRWISIQRVERARQLIDNSDLQLAEIARQVGFTSDSTFRRHFREQYSVSAREYRKAIEDKSKIQY